ncbi:MAG: hypothetical protein IJZ19_05835 [Lentisphaeria bacterium]|nr:hypothetical protein [Lentisphaeria bacterium]
MKVKHIHAKRGEYVAVHRGSNNGSGLDLLYIVIFMVAIWFIYKYWQVVAFFTVCAAVLWLIWTFRSFLFKIICWFVKRFWRLIVFCFIQSGQFLKRIFSGKISNTTPALNETSFANYKHSADYGKIVQHRR